MMFLGEISPLEEIRAEYPESDIVPGDQDTPAGVSFESERLLALRAEAPLETQPPYAPPPVVVQEFKVPVIPLLVGGGALAVLWLVFKKKTT